MTSVTKYQIYEEMYSRDTHIERLLVKNFEIKCSGKRSYEYDNDDILFIGIVRESYYWINSIYINRKDIWNDEELNKKTPIEFITAEIPKDEEMKEKYKNIYRFREIRSRFLLYDLRTKVKNYILLKYEDVRDKPEEILEFLWKEFNLTKKSEHFEDVESSHIQDMNRPIPREAFLKNLNIHVELQLGYKVDNLKIIFCHLPKCGGITINTILHKHLGKYYGNSAHTPIHEKDPKIKYIGNIRNPFEFYVSRWKYGIEKEHFKETEDFKKWLYNYKGFGLAYRRDSVIMEKYNIGFFTMRFFQIYNKDNYDLLNYVDENPIINEFIRCETIFLDIKRIFGIEAEEIKLNMSNHLPYQEYYDEKMKKYIYQKDSYIFKKFGYSF